MGAGDSLFTGLIMAILKKRSLLARVKLVLDVAALLPLRMNLLFCGFKPLFTEGRKLWLAAGTRPFCDGVEMPSPLWSRGAPPASWLLRA